MGTFPQTPEPPYVCTRPTEHEDTTKSFRYGVISRRNASPITRMSVVANLLASSSAFACSKSQPNFQPDAAMNVSCAISKIFFPESENMPEQSCFINRLSVPRTRVSPSFKQIIVLMSLSLYSLQTCRRLPGPPPLPPCRAPDSSAHSISAHRNGAQ